jgi:polar amino acid transport system substrate-binding protein
MPVANRVAIGFAITLASSLPAKADVMKELAPTEKLRVAIAVASAPSALYAVKDEATGQYRGVTVELGAAMAKTLGVPVEFVSHLASGEIQNSANANRWDVTFMPVDKERKKFVDFGNAYHLLRSTYLVAPGAKITKIDEVNEPGVRIGGVANTATFRAAQRSAPKATFVTVPGVDAAVAAMKAGEIDCIALSRESDCKNPRFAHPRRRVSELVDRRCGAKGETRGACLCERIHRAGQGGRTGAQGI